MPLFLTLAAAACDTDDSLESTNTRATAIVVDPAEFLGAFPCGPIEGAPQSYRATLKLLDIPDGANDDFMTVSPRVGCGTPVAFTGVTGTKNNDDGQPEKVVEGVDSGSRYVASIEVFDVPASADAGDPAWTTTCGDAVPAVGRLLEQVVVRDCIALTGPGTAETGIAVDATAAAADLGCLDVADGETPGLIDSLNVINTTEDVGGTTVTIACGQDPVRFQTDIEPGSNYTFRIEGEDADGNVIAGASCEAVARDGLVVPASCTPLSDRAELVIPVVDLLAEADIVCGEDATAVRAALTAGPTNTAPEKLGCDRDVTVSGVEAGSYLASLEVLDGSSTVMAFSCTGSAPPGSQTTLVCTLED